MVPRSFAVFDIDGVVADVRHRLHHLHTEPKDWSGFFAGAAEDPILAEGSALAHHWAQGHELVWLTGRPERLRTVTADWLARADLPAGELLMRGDRDRRPAHLVKAEALLGLSGRGSIAVVVDDDLEVVAALTAAGLPVLLADWVAQDATLHTAQEGDGRT